jgi:hypothetical protein
LILFCYHNLLPDVVWLFFLYCLIVRILNTTDKKANCDLGHSRFVLRNTDKHYYIRYELMSIGILIASARFY